jgi:hypothetical protein
MIIEFVDKASGDRVARIDLGASRPQPGDTVARGGRLYEVVGGINWAESTVGSLVTVFGSVEVAEKK